MGDISIPVGDKLVVIPAELEAPPSGELLWSEHGPFSTIEADQHVVLDVDANIMGVLTIKGTLRFDPFRSISLRTTNSVIVEGGMLTMNPAYPLVQHSLTFEGFTDALYGPGGGDVVVPSDIGLWCHMGGVLDLHGAPKRSWTNLSASARSLDDLIHVEDATGWMVGDEIVITSTTPHATGARLVNQNGWERRTVAAVIANDGVVRLTTPLVRDHLPVSSSTRVYYPEVLNLTRNVKVQGTPAGRAHAHVMAHDGHGMPFDMSYVELAHVGPARGSADSEGRFRNDVLGRYGLHFHKTGWALAGSMMTGLVVRDSRSHAFVPHMSHGLTFRDCISHVSHQTAYWWDFPTSGSDNEDSIPTHELVYESCVASATASATGFFLGFGYDQKIRDCVVTGSINNNSFDNGVQAYTWDSSSRPLDHTVVPPGRSGVWIFENNLAHNTNGPANYWQNNVGNTKVKGLQAYYCNHMVRAGAYTNAVDYLDFWAYRVGAETDSDASFDIHASSQPPGGARSGFWIEANGENLYALRASNPPVLSSNPTVIRDGFFKGGTRAQILIENPNMNIINCTFVGNAFWVASTLPGTANVTVNDPVNGHVRLWPLSSTRGTPHPAWNCRVEPI